MIPLGEGGGRFAPAGKALGMICPHPRRRLSLLAVAALGLVMAKSRDGASDTATGPTPTPSWPVGRVVPVAVRDGRTRFDVPTPNPGSKTLVIVSTLGRVAESQSIRMVARPAYHARPVERAQAPASRPPSSIRFNPPTVPAPATGLPPAHRAFHMLDRAGDAALAANYRAVDGQLAAVGRRIQIYVDSVDRGFVAEATLRDLVETFDEHVFPAAALRFGPAADVDRDGRFTVLFSSGLSRLAPSKAGVDGYVRGADLDPGLREPFGNRCDLMYLSTSLVAGPRLRTIVAHEYAHAVGFSRKALDGRPGTQEEEDWLDEAIAHLVEDDHGFSRSNLDYRVSAFLSRPERYRLVVDDYYAADLFRSHGNRGATYLFLRWCVDRHGSGLLDALVRSEARGVANLEAATGSTFADLFRRWTVALALSGVDPATEPAEPYRTLDPRGEFEDAILAGPRMAHLKPGGPVDSWTAEATTAHYALIEGSKTGAITVEISGPPGADLQVTAIAWPKGLGRTELVVRQVPSDDGVVMVQARVTECDGGPVRLGAISWEPLTPSGGGPHPGASRGRLDSLGIAASFGTSTLPAGGTLNSHAIHPTGVRAIDAPLVFKAVGFDARGQRIVAWSEVAPLDPPSLSDR